MANNFLDSSNEDETTSTGTGEPTESPSLGDLVERAYGFDMRIPGYRVVRRLKGGGQGEVFEAIQLQSSRTVAIKVPKHGTRPTQTEWVRFKREMRILSHLDHAHIVPLIEWGETTTHMPYFVMDFVYGSRLNDYVREHKLPVVEILKLFHTICSAVDHAHRRNIIHRDLNPSNILVNESGQPMIIDFGLGRFLREPFQTIVTKPGDMIGTFHYMSPEHAAAMPNSIDTRSDVYSLGVILYELLTGVSPYPEVSRLIEPLAYIEQITRHIRETLPAPLAQTWSAEKGAPAVTSKSKTGAACPIDSNLETLTRCCLSKDPNLRYQDAGELLDILSGYLAGRNVRARPVRRWYTLRKRVQSSIRRHPFGAACAGVVLAAMLARFLFAPAVYHWTPWLNRSTATIFHLLAKQPTDSLANVSVILLGDDPDGTTPLDPLDVRTDVAKLAQTLRIEGVDPLSAPTFRPLYGRLMERLSVTTCKVLAWDIFLVGKQPGDEDFVKGARAFCGKPGSTDARHVVVAYDNWPFRPEENTLSETIIGAPLIDRGGASADTTKLPWIVVIAVQRDAAVRPSLALAVLSRFRNPESSITPIVDLSAETLQLAYQVGSAPSETEFVPVSSIERKDKSTANSFINPGDIFADYYLETVPSQGALAAVTKEFGKVLLADDATLKQWFDDKIVFIGKRRGGKDIFPLPGDGRIIPGPCIHAIAVDALLRNTAVRTPRALDEYVIPLLAAAAGACIPHITRKRRTGALQLISMGLATMALTGIAYSYFRYLLDPFLPMVSLILAFALVSVVIRIKARQAHAFS